MRDSLKAVETLEGAATRCELRKPVQRLTGRPRVNDMSHEATQLWANPRVRAAFIRIAREIAEKHRGAA